jgi:cytochrome c2
LRIAAAAIGSAATNLKDPRMISRIATAASLALALAACGSSKEPSDQPTEAAAVPAETAAPAPLPSDTSVALATPSAAPTPTPTASASAAGDHEDKKSDHDDVAPAGPPQAFQQCAACHSTERGKTIIGPSLAGVYGHKAGQVPGFQFSDAMKNSGLVLNEQGLDRFLADPKGTVPGTIMALNGIKDHEQREAIIDYLKTLK